jgi:hypothetical protein
LSMTPTQLYRHFDASDRLLYIGISRCAWKRLQQHLASSPWREQFFRMTVEDYPTRGAAIDAEAAAILAEQPTFNKEGRRPASNATFNAVEEMAKFERWLARPRTLNEVPAS